MDDYCYSGLPYQVSPDLELALVKGEDRYGFPLYRTVSRRPRGGIIAFHFNVGAKVSNRYN